MRTLAVGLVLLSAATAAAEAMERGAAVQAIDYARLHDRLVKDQQILAWRPKKQGGILLPTREAIGVAAAEAEGYFRSTRNKCSVT